MKTQVVTLSPQGQFSIPARFRPYLHAKKYVLEIRDDIVVFKPCRVMMNPKDSFVNKALLDKILGLPPEQKELLNLIRKKACSSEHILDELHLPVPQTTVLLSELELAGLIHRNKYYLWEAKFGQ
jgi:predicted Rossmann fold nucleotide-binding protein DprA/Smf involved in DNA uptake